MTPRQAFRVTWPVVRWVFAAIIAAVLLIILPAHPPEVINALTPMDLTTTDYSHGFFLPQMDDTGRQYVWTAPRAATTFTFVGNRPFDLVLTLRSAAIAGGPDAPVHILINGTEVQLLHLDPKSAQFQTVRMPITPAKGGDLTVQLQAEPFSPKGDRRTLGTLVQRIAIDRSSSWSAIARRQYLYSALPLIGLLAAACLALAWRREAATVGATSIFWLRYVAFAACATGAVAMLVAVGILMRIGQIDENRSLLWLAGSTYLAGFFGVVAIRLPVGATGSHSLWSALPETAFMRPRGTRIVAMAQAALFALTTLLTLHFLASPGTGDVDDKLRWMRNIAAHGLVGGFQVSADDYPPGTYIVLAALTKLAPHFGIGAFITYKLSIVAFLLLSGLIAWRWTRNACFAIALHLALIVDSVVMGYNDVYFVAPLLLALWALRARKMVWFAVLFTLACLMKWQPLILLPFLLSYAVLTMTTREHRWRDVARLARSAALPAAMMFVATLAIFGPEFLFEFRRATSENFLSANALNVHWIVTQALAWWNSQRFSFGPDTHRQFIRIPSATILTLMKLPFAAIYLGILTRFVQGPRTYATMLHYAYVGYLAYFLFNTSVHENHLVPAVVLAGLLWTTDRRYGPLFLITTVMLNLNLLLFYRLDGFPRLPVVVHGLDLSLPLAILNVTLFVALLMFGPRLVLIPNERMLAAASMPPPSQIPPHREPVYARSLITVSGEGPDG